MESATPKPQPDLIRLPYKYSPLNPLSESTETFRLLILLPGCDDSEICCEIRHESLTSPPPYEALSYTWGSPKGPENAIPCRGDPDSLFEITIGDRFLNIGYNLACALKQLRSSTASRSLWVDAISINQSDDEEKSYQVSMMAHVYERASRVIAWLGEEDDFTDLAFDIIEELCWAAKAVIWQYCRGKIKKPGSLITEPDVLKVIKYEREAVRPIRGSHFQGNISDYETRQLVEAFRLVPLADQHQAMDLEDAAENTFGKSRTFARWLVSSEPEFLKNFLDSKFDQLIDILNEIFYDRSYWRRLWVVQELVLASQAIFVCGKRNIDLKLFEITYYIFRSLLNSNGGSNLFKCLNYGTLGGLDRAMVDVLAFIVSRNRDQGYFSLKYQLRMHAFRSCSDPRDNIFALIQISQPIGLVANYHLSVSEVFTEATRKVIKKEQKLDFIFFRPRLDQAPFLERAELPSWVPRFETTLKYTDTAGFDAGGINQENYIISTVDGNPEILPIKGHSFDDVIRIFPTFDFLGRSHQDIWRDILNLKDQLGISKSRREQLKHLLTLKRYRMKFSGSELWDIFWRTLVMDEYQEDINTMGKPLRHNTGLKKSYMKNIELGLTNAMALDNNLMETLGSASDEKTFCILESGLPALVHGDAKEGDKIFIARGASLPLVIRPVKSETTADASDSTYSDTPKYTFVGGVYVHGIMDGQWIRQKEKENIAEEHIYLI